MQRQSKLPNYKKYSSIKYRKIVISTDILTKDWVKYPGWTVFINYIYVFYKTTASLGIWTRKRHKVHPDSANLYRIVQHLVQQKAAWRPLKPTKPTAQSSISYIATHHFFFFVKSFRTWIDKIMLNTELNNVF